MDCFEIKMPEDFYGVDLTEEEDAHRFRKARPGDHLCSAFQCPHCQSQNIRGCNLINSIPDESFKCLCIRATLDTFWAHSTNTVGNHLRETRFLLRYGESMGFQPLPPLGPFPLGEHLGMMQAIVLEARSMEKGRKNETVQYGTARMIRATMTKLWESSPASGADITLSSGSVKGRYIATLCPSEGRWYQLFNKGVSARMGDVVGQDRAYTLDVLLELLKLYEMEWEEHDYSIPRQTISTVMFLLVTCLGGMRGFEAVWTDAGALREDVMYAEEIEDESAVAWPIVGRFKAEGGQAGCHFIPIAGTTDKSKIPFFRWTQRFVACLSRDGIKEGWAFRKADGITRAVAADYREDIFSKLEHIQRHTSLIEPSCNVWDDYGVQRSGRRFFTSQCLLNGISPTDIALQCRWQEDRANGERTVHRSMVHTYAEMRNMKDALIRPSKSF